MIQDIHTDADNNDVKTIIIYLYNPISLRKS